MSSMVMLACSGRVARGFVSKPSSRIPLPTAARPRGALSMAMDSRTLRFYNGGSTATLLEPVTTTMVKEVPSESTNGRPRVGRYFSSIAERPFSNGDTPESQQEQIVNVKEAPPPRQSPPESDGQVISVPLSKDEAHLFELLRQVTEETHLQSNLRVAGGWVRDKLLATPDFQKFHRYKLQDETPQGQRLTSKFQKGHGGNQASMGRQGTKIMSAVSEETNQPVDIDIALDDMLGREFADHLNEYLSHHGQKTVSVGVVLKNPEKSKHLETATMKVESFWIDFVNLRAEEYTQDSRIPDLMRIGTPCEDAFRRDLTINALFYNINTQQVEDWTGRGFEDLRRGVVATPLAPLTTLLDDPLRVLRSVRFAARLRFNMDEALVKAARNERVRFALAQKVSRERVGGEVDLMLRSPDPVGAMRLLSNLNLLETVFPVNKVLPADYEAKENHSYFAAGLDLLSTTHDYVCDCKVSPPVWCNGKQKMTTHGFVEKTLLDDDEARRLLWYAAFLKPLMNVSNRLDETRASPAKGKKQNRSVIHKLLVDHLKRPARDAEAVERIMRAADDFTQLINNGFDLSAASILLSDIDIQQEMQLQNGHSSSSDTTNGYDLSCRMNGKIVCSETENDPLWQHAMEFRLLTSRVLERCGHLWRAALILSLSEQLLSPNDDFFAYAIEGDVYEESQEEERSGIVQRYDTFAAALQKLGLIGIWSRKPLLDGDEIKKKVLPNLPRGPVFREVMDEQEMWMTTHPNGGKEALERHLKNFFPEFI